MACEARTGTGRPCGPPNERAADGRERSESDGGDRTWESLSALDDAYRTPVDCATAGVEYGDGDVSVRLGAGCSQVAGYDGGCAFADDAQPEE